MQITHFTRDGCLVVALTGKITVATAPQIQRELLKDLAEGPSAIICDLSGVDTLDPVCATVFATVANHPVSRWPATSLLLCGGQPAVAKVLGSLGVRHVLPLYDNLQEAIDAAGARPGYLRDELRLAPTPTAVAAARRFVGETLQSWGLGPPDTELSEQAQLLADELVTNAVVHARTNTRLRLELGGELLHIAVGDLDPRLPRLLPDDPQAQGGRGLRLVEWVAAAWGAQLHPGGGKVVWCTLRTSKVGGPRPAAAETPLPPVEPRPTPPPQSSGTVLRPNSPSHLTATIGAFRETPTLPLPDDTAPIDGWLALRRAVMCRHGVEQLRSDAELACRLVPTGSRLRAPAVLLLGVSYLLVEDLDTADGLLAEAVEVAEDTGTADTAAVALAERALIRIDGEAWDRAELLVEQGRSLLERAHTDEFATNVLLHAVAARLAVHHGEVLRARQDLAHGQRLRPQLTVALPVFAVQARLELVRAYLALTDAAGARTVLREVDDLLWRRPRLGVLGQQAEELRDRVDTLRADVVGASSLTAAELRLLPLLTTHLTFREIGERLYVSSHTVKTQAMSLYRKLGVSSRSQAIEHAQQLGLLRA
jgi:anti-anti-sigma factor